MSFVYMNRKFSRTLWISILAVLVMALSASAAWKTTKAGRIYTASGRPGYLTGWQKVGKARYYFNKKNGVMATGWNTIKAKKVSYRYYFGDDGKLRTGFFNADGYSYYADAKGRLQFGFLVIEGKRYYADPSTGILAKKQWVDDASGSYYFQADGSMAVNQIVQGNYVGADGRSMGIRERTGFVRMNRMVYYYSASAGRMTGWLDLGGNRYYLAPDLKTGWFTVGSATYYADGDGAIVKNTWMGKKYLGASGALAKGWTDIGRNRYYFGPDGNYLKGSKAIDGKKYRFSNEGVLSRNEWYIAKKGVRYYYGADGAACTGKTLIDKKYYFFGKNGRLKYGLITDGNKKYYAHKKRGYLFSEYWIKKGSKKYYALESCELATGLQVIKGKIYIFSKKGGMFAKMKRTVDGKTYYLGADGVAVTNTWKKIKGNYYYFGEDGAMVKNKIVDGYVIDSNGVRGGNAAGKWVTKNGKKYYVVGGKNATGLTVINGSTYYFDANGVMQTGIQDVAGKKRYFYPGGNMAIGITLAVGSKEYTINSSGIVTSEKTIDVSGNSKGSNIAKFAIKYVGNPYVYGGTSLTNGADCSGFVMSVFGNFGIKLLRVANDQMNGPGSAYAGAGYKKAVIVGTSTSSLLPGDLLFYGSGNYASHVAIYIGNGRVVHASNSQPYPAGGIKISYYDYQTPIRAVRYWS